MLSCILLSCVSLSSLAGVLHVQGRSNGVSLGCNLGNGLPRVDS
jgi:hypothetical protein